MTSAVFVVKFNGTGNTFALVDARQSPLSAPQAFARRICDPLAGLGTDGLLLLGPSSVADVQMRIINADGSEAEMCGNGVRCVARYLDEHDGRSEAVVETLAGPIRTRIVAREPAYLVAAEVNAPEVGPQHTIAGFAAIPVDVGNPHVVIFVDDLEAIELAEVGPRIERAPRYPHGTNVHFARIIDRRIVEVVHWERGAGATQACGTGAVAAAAAAITTRGLRSPVELHVPGGVLSVAWEAPNRAVMTGGATRETETMVGVPA